MNENSPICARPMPTRSEVRSIVPGEEGAERSNVNTLPTTTTSGDDRDGTGVLHEQRGIDEQADGDEEDRAEHVAHGLEQALDLRESAAPRR